jgi:hypothetical protein
MESRWRGSDGRLAGAGQGASACEEMKTSGAYPQDSEPSTHVVRENFSPEPARRLMPRSTMGDWRSVRIAIDGRPAPACRRGRGPRLRAPLERLHYMYEGDTALHMAAAAYQTSIVEALIVRGADVRARNRRGAELLHYAVDGGPGLSTWDPSAQAKIIARLIRAGADPNAVDKSGVAPLHRAVRNRCAAAVKALIDGGAGPACS